MSKFIRALSAFTYLALLTFLPVAFDSPASAVAPQSTIYLTAWENNSIDYTAPDGYVIDHIDFASYGTPENYQLGWCHAADSQSIVESYTTLTVLNVIAGNWLFGDPCGGTYKKLSVILTITQITPEVPKRLNPPTNLSANYVGRDLVITWDKPEPTSVSIERYAVTWSAGTESISAVSSTTNSITLPEIIFTQTYGFDTLYTFTVRADNDTLSIYSDESEPVEVFIFSPKPTPSPTVEPSPTPTTTPTPTIEPSVSPTPTPTKEPEPQPSKSSTPQESPKPVVTSSPEPTPIIESTVEPTTSSQEEQQVLVDNASSDGIISQAETQAIVDNLLSDGNLSQDEVANLVDNLQADGQLTEEEKQLVTDVLVETYADTAIPADVFVESGLDYSDLPPEQPITLENGVVLTANVADALQIFEAPSEILSAVFTDPSKALTAIANVGADMTPETRKTAQQATIPAVIVTQVIAGTASLLTRKI